MNHKIEERNLDILGVVANCENGHPTHNCSVGLPKMEDRGMGVIYVRHIDYWAYRLLSLL